jgi:hypothetical protein
LRAKISDERFYVNSPLLSERTIAFRSHQRIPNRIAEQFDVHPNQITSWKAQLESGAADVFGPGGGSAAQPAIDVKSHMPRSAN